MEETSLTPFFVADHPALDLLNTVAKIDGKRVDFLQTDGDVLSWMEKMEWAPANAPKLPKEALLTAARTLREAVRTLVHRRKEGKRSDPSTLNAYLRESVSHSELVWPPSGSPKLEQRREIRTPAQLLAPVAESGAELICSGDFELVRPCANPECVLWFYDRTKSHRRRWCSMAACGNRHKVTAFRQRHDD